MPTELDKILNKALKAQPLDRGELIALLSLEEQEDLKKLYSTAYKIKKREIGTGVSLRGIIELSNICRKNCLYCGVRSGNRNVERFMLSQDEVLAGAKKILDFGYGSLVLQSGERVDKKFILFIEDTVRKIKVLSGGKLGITLSLGEQDKNTYERWFKAGAHRYLLRIESSSPELYRRLHPADHLYERRVKCLHFLQDTGYQVGTGVMIGLPWQTAADLADDLLFMKNFDIDMVGMGPYIVHQDTPLAKATTTFYPDRQLKLGLKMIAALRCLMRDINIASTTALQALSPTGREQGLMAGGNVIMPNVTATEYRGNYQLYDNKPAINENADESREALEKSIASVGETVAYNQWGDSKHFFKRISQNGKVEISC